MKSMGRYKCQGIVSTLSVIILVLCFVITSHQVSMENHGFEIHLMTFCERTNQQLIELDAFTVVIKHDTVETNIDMFNNVIWPLTQNILKITGIMSLKFGTPHCLQGTPFLGTHGVPGTPKC